MQIAETFRKYVPGQRWDWLQTAGQLFEGVEASIERHEGIRRSTMTHGGQSSVVHFDFKARPYPRSARVLSFPAVLTGSHVPTSVAFTLNDESPPALSGGSV